MSCCFISALLLYLYSISFLWEARSWPGSSYKLLSCRQNAHRNLPTQQTRKTVKRSHPTLQPLQAQANCYPVTSCAVTIAKWPFLALYLSWPVSQPCPISQERRVKSGQGLSYWLQGAVGNRTIEAAMLPDISKFHSEFFPGSLMLHLNELAHRPHRDQ